MKQLISLVLGLWLLLVSTTWYAFVDETTIHYNNASYKLMMDQNGSSLYFDVVNTSGKTIACQIADGEFNFSGLWCNNRSFSTTRSEVTIYMQIEWQQFTIKYNTSTRRFVSTGIGHTLVPTPNPIITPNPIHQTTLQVWTDRTTLSTNQYTDLTVRLVDQFGSVATQSRDQLRFSILRRNTNGTYSVASNFDYTLSPTSYTMSHTDSGQRRFADAIRFFTAGEYRVRVENLTTNRQAEVNVVVTSSTTPTTQTRISLTSATSSPSVNTFVPLTISVRDQNNNLINNYNNRLRFEIWRRSSAASSWQDITSSFLDNSAYRMFASSYVMPFNNDGTATIDNAIRFHQWNYEYQVRVIEEGTNVVGSMIFAVGNTNTSTPTPSVSTLYRFVGEVVTTPEINRWNSIRISVRDRNNSTITHANQRINFRIESKTTAWSQVWRNATSTQCRLDISSYTFHSNDNGQATLRDLVRCARPGFYRIVMTNHADSRFVGYVYLTIPDTSRFATTLRGFNSAERDMIREDYLNFMNQINRYEMNNTHLAYNWPRNRLWSAHYNKLFATVHGRAGRWTSYQSYLNARNDFEYEMSRVRR